MTNRELKFWIGVACKEHVEKGLERGTCQFCHGKSGPVKRLHKGDFIIYYASKITMKKPEPYQKFTAIGIVEDDTPHQIDMGNNFMPFIRKVKYFDAKELDIRPLIPMLPFIKNKTSWGYVFRYGFLEIDQESFEIIAQGMLGFNPIVKKV